MPRQRLGGLTTSIALACLLLFAQWTGFTMVLCVSGAGHAAVEFLDSGCCARPAAGAAGLYGDSEPDCAGCTDLAIQNASASDSARGRYDPAASGVACSPPVNGRLEFAAAEESFVTVCLTPASGPPHLSAPLRC